MKYYLSLFLITSLWSCSYIDNLTASGDVISEDINVPEFKQLVADAPCNIFLQNGHSNTIRMEGFDYLLEDLKLESKDGILTISHPKKDYMQQSKLPTLYIGAELLQKITANTPILLESTDTIKSNHFSIIVNGGAKFTEMDLIIKCQKLTLNVFGNNNIGNNKLAGQVKSANFSIEGSVNLDALNLLCEQVSVAHKSIGDCYTSPIETLKVSTYSAGNTFYKGEPQVEHIRIEVPYLTSSGEVIKMDK